MSNGRDILLWSYSYLPWIMYPLVLVSESGHWPQIIRNSQKINESVWVGLWWRFSSHKRTFAIWHACFLAASGQIYFVIPLPMHFESPYSLFMPHQPSFVVNRVWRFVEARLSARGIKCTIFGKISIHNDDALNDYTQLSLCEHWNGTNI